MTVPRVQHDFPASFALLILRLGAGGLLFLGHGWAKLVHYREWAASFPDPLSVGSPVSFALVVFAEVVCAPVVMLGLLTRLATIPILIFLGVAGFIQLAHDPWTKRELAFIYAVPFLTLLLAGGGRFSLDGWLAGRRGRGGETGGE